MERKPRRIAPNDASQSHLSAEALEDVRPIRFIPYTVPTPPRTSTRPAPPATTQSRNTTRRPISTLRYANPSRLARFPTAVFHPPYTPAAPPRHVPTPPAPPVSQPPSQTSAADKNKDDDLIVISSDEEDAVERNNNQPKGKSMQDAINLDDDDEDDVDILTVSPSPATEQQQTAITIDDDEQDPSNAIEKEGSVTPMQGQQQGQSTMTTLSTQQHVPSSPSLISHDTTLAVYQNQSSLMYAPLLSLIQSALLQSRISESDNNDNQSTVNTSIVDKANDSLVNKDVVNRSIPTTDSKPSSSSSSSCKAAANSSIDQKAQHQHIKQEEQRSAGLTTMSSLQPKEEKSWDTSVDKMDTIDNLVATSSATSPATTTTTTATGASQESDDMDMDEEESDDDSVSSAELLFDSATPSVSKLDVDLMYALNASEMDNSDQPDWSALARLSIQDDDNDAIDTTTNNIPSLVDLTSRPIATAISLNDDVDDENRILEMLSHIDAYELSLESLLDKTNATSSAQMTTSIRHGSKRRKTTSCSGPPAIKAIKPYVPVHVWTHTTWEDWAQLQVGDWLHWPFEAWEIQRMQHGLDQYNKKRHPVLNIKPEIWQIMSEQLPGRRPEDCKRYWRDCELGMIQPFHNPIIIGKGKGSSGTPSQFDLVQDSKVTNHFRVTSARRVLWSELEYHESFGDGSADAIALQVIKSRRQRGDRLKVVVASACNDQPEYNMPGNLRLWSADTKKITQLPYHRTESSVAGGTQYMWHTVTDVRLSNDHRFIYSASHDKSARVWDSKSGKLLSTLVFHEKRIHQLAVSSERTEHILASGSADGTAVVWRLQGCGNVGAGIVCDMASKMPPESKDRVSIDTLAFGTGLSAGKLFTGVVTGLTGPDDPAGFVQVYDASNGKGVMRLTSMTRAVCDIDVSSTGKLIASANYGGNDGLLGDGCIHIHDIRAPQAAILAKTGHTDVNVVRLSPCERYVASGSPYNETAIVDIRKPNEPIFRLRHERQADSGRLEPINSDMGIAGIHWMSNTRQLLTGGGDSSVKLWDIWENGEMVRSYDTSSNVTSLAVDEDSMVICAGVSGSQGYVHVFTGAQL